MDGLLLGYPYSCFLFSPSCSPGPKRSENQVYNVVNIIFILLEFDVGFFCLLFTCLRNWVVRNDLGDLSMNTTWRLTILGCLLKSNQRHEILLTNAFFVPLSVNLIFFYFSLDPTWVGWTCQVRSSLGSCAFFQAHLRAFTCVFHTKHPHLVFISLENASSAAGFGVVEDDF